MPHAIIPCRAWALYFEYESEFAGWQQLYGAAVAAFQAAEAEGPAAAAAQQQQRLGELAAQTLPLLGAMLDFLGQRGLDCLVGCGDAADALAAAGAPLELALVVGPDAGADTAAEVQQGAAFPSFADGEEQAAVGEALAAALGAAAGGLPAEVQQQLGAVAAGPASDDMPGLVAGACGWWRRELA